MEIIPIDLVNIIFTYCDYWTYYHVKKRYFPETIQLNSRIIGKSFYREYIRYLYEYNQFLSQNRPRAVDLMFKRLEEYILKEIMKVLGVEYNAVFWGSSILYFLKNSKHSERDDFTVNIYVQNIKLIEAKLKTIYPEIKFHPEGYKSYVLHIDLLRFRIYIIDNDESEIRSYLGAFSYGDTEPNII